jgi:hypothetical protein
VCKGQGVLRLGELNARIPALGDDVVDLLGNFGVGKGWKVGKSLEKLVVDGGPDLEEGGGGGSVGHRESRSSCLVEKSSWLKANIGLGWGWSSLGLGGLHHLRGNSNESSHGRHVYVWSAEGRRWN